MQEPSSDFNQKFTTIGLDCHKADAVEDEKSQVERLRLSTWLDRVVLRISALNQTGSNTTKYDYSAIVRETCIMSWNAVWRSSDVVTAPPISRSEIVQMASAFLPARAAFI